MVQADEEEPEKQANGTKEWLQPFVLMAVVLDSDRSTDSIDTRLNKVRADIQKKLRQDPYRGNNAMDTILLPSNKFDDGKGFSGIAVAVAVEYRTLENDPYTKG